MPDPRSRHRHRHRKQKKAQRQLNWFTWSLALIFWCLIILTIIFIDPVYLKDILIPNSYSPFFILLTLTLTLSLWNFFHNLFRTFLYTASIVAFLFLRLHHLGHYLNALLILGLIATFEYYFNFSSPRHKHTTTPPDPIDTPTDTK